MIFHNSGNFDNNTSIYTNEEYEQLGYGKEIVISDDEIDLELSDKLKNKNIIQKFVKHKKDNYLKLELNHKYEKSTFILQTNNIKDWSKFHDTLDKEFDRKGIQDKEDIRLIHNVVDDNHELILGLNNDETTNNNDNNNIKDQEKEERKSLAQILVGLISEENSVTKLFKDEFNVPHIIVMIQDHYEVLPINSTKFKRYLTKLYYDTKKGKIANPEAINSAVSQLEAKATFESQTIPLHLRTAWNNPDTTNEIYYDLSDEKNRCVKINKNGWEIVENQINILFRKYPHLKPQVEPIGITIDNIDSKMFDEFISLFNIKNKEENNKDDNTLLLKCYIISLFIPDIPKSILLLHGEQGGAKSTFQELIKMLVDPSSIQTLTFPRDPSEFIQQLSHNSIVYYDNVSTIPEWISDLLCRAVTGSSFSKRALWTNDDDIYYNFKRIVGINGIDLAATKADLLDRSIIIQTERIDKKDRKKIKEIWEEFNQLKPYVLGYIFDVLVKVLKYKAEHGEIDFPNGLNRMADWEEYCEIISRCMGNPEGEFQRVYQENIGIQVDEAIESSPLSQTIIELINDRVEENYEVTKTPTEMYKELVNTATSKLNIDPLKIKSFPKSSNALTRRINSVKTNLREKGIEITIGKDEKGKRFINIRKILSISSISSKPTESSTNQSKKFDSISNNELISSKEIGENQAQKLTFDSIDNIDSILQTNKEKQEQDQESIPSTIHRIHPNSDIWECDNCTMRDDKWGMMKHPCKHNKKKKQENHCNE